MTVRQRLDEVLERPLAPDETAKRAASDPDWGLTPDAVAASQEADSYFGWEG